MMRVFISRASKLVTAAASAACLGIGAAGADDVMPLFEKDPDAVLMLSKVPEPNSYYYVLVERAGSEEPEELIGEIESTQHLFYPQFYPKEEIPEIIADGARMVVRGREEYVEVFGADPRDWPSIVVIRSEVDLIPAEPAVQPDGVVSVPTFEAARKSYLAALPPCTPGQSPEEPRLPETPAEVELVRKSALDGDPDAQWVMGVLYEFARHVEKNPAKAVDWYEKSAAQCNRHALNSLGRAHYYGIAVPIDLLKAQFYFLKSIALGNSLAAYNLGAMLVRDEGVLAGWSSVGEDWLSVAYRDGNPVVRQRAFALIAAQDQKQMRARRASRYRPPGAASGGMQGENCDTTFGFSCNAGVDALGANIWMGVK